jgi:hypothetical protein
MKNKIKKFTSYLILPLFLAIWQSVSHAADLPALSKLYQENYQRFYKHGLCGQNILRLLEEAHRQGIDLSNVSVLKIEGAGFLETSGFYTRHAKNQRAMLGYFHVVMVADNIVFDFDLADKLMPTLENYVRLQFTPPYEPFIIFGISYQAQKELPWWKVTRFEWHDYLQQAPMTWKKNLGEVVDLKAVLALPR